MFTSGLIRLAVVALAALPAMHANAQESIFGPPGASASQPVAPSPVTAPGAATAPPAEGASGAGGAVFSPFAQTSMIRMPRHTEAAWYSNIDGADMTFAAVAALVCPAALARVRRRA